MRMSYKNEKMNLYFIYNKMHVSFMEIIGRLGALVRKHLSTCLLASDASYKL